MIIQTRFVHPNHQNIHRVLYPDEYFWELSTDDDTSIDIEYRDETDDYVFVPEKVDGHILIKHDKCNANGCRGCNLCDMNQTYFITVTKNFNDGILANTTGRWYFQLRMDDDNMTSNDANITEEFLDLLVTLIHMAECQENQN